MPISGQNKKPQAGNEFSTPAPVTARKPLLPADSTSQTYSQDTDRISVATDAPDVHDKWRNTLQDSSPILEEGKTEGEGVEREEFASDRDDEEPFDPTKIRITSKEPTVSQVVERVKRKEIDLEPDFQRAGNIWSIQTQSRLIESLLLKIPLPVFYVAADPDDNWQVVDGLQRLNTLRNFILGDSDKKLRLRGLEYLDKFEQQAYDDLPRPMQRRINETQLSCHVIEPGTPPEVMFNVFKRINTAGKPLVGQEIRHALNPGPARSLLNGLADSQEFKKATDGTVNPKRMADRECVLRFLAFRSLGDDAYPGKLDGFLMEAMRILNNRNIHSSLSADFHRAMSLASDIFGQEAFRKPASHIGRRNPVNKSLFESLSVALAEVSDERAAFLRKKKENIVNQLNKLMEDPQFHESISTGTGKASQVKIRFENMRNLIHRTFS